MKRIILLTVILFFATTLSAQKDSTFYSHEVRASFGGGLMSAFWFGNKIAYVQFSVGYFYRPVKWFWVGGNFINYFGPTIYYHWREYNPDGSFKDFSKSKPKYYGVFAPEVRFSYLNKKQIILYSALSGGIAFENGYDELNQKYPRILPYFHITTFGVSGNFGKDKNIFFGGELGFGFKGVLNIHAGYRF
jgi:hypothetical protein